ncbi:MAG TPA: isoprenylcysteine carboxylmethyltransferase family protein [Phycisphaerae bacterium]|nr:isoprenylcysteine carboxylmethyltransferase family protein [Phycisphaerae bacterium]
MDDGRLRRAMVDGPTPLNPPPERPFALRSTIYTAGFLLVILAVVPSVFYLLGEWILTSIPARFIIQAYWTGFRTLLGIAVFTIGLAAYLYCSIWLIYHGRGPHVEFDPPKVFVATGPYRWVRNPVVITLLVAFLGEVIFFASLGLIVLFVLGVAFAHYQVTRIEEPRLATRFGESYAEYCRQVPRWLPQPPRETTPPPQ